MPESHRLYLDQVLRVEVAPALRNEGYDVLRAVEVGQDRADDYQNYRKPLLRIEFLLLLTSILAIGLFYRSVSIPE